MEVRFERNAFRMGSGFERRRVLNEHFEEEAPLERRRVSNGRALRTEARFERRRVSNGGVFRTDARFERTRVLNGRAF